MHHYHLPKAKKFSYSLVISFARLKNYSCEFFFSNSNRSADLTIKVWNCETGELYQTLEGHSGAVNCFQVLNDGNLASGSDDKSIKIWNFKVTNLVFLFNFQKMSSQIKE